MDNLICCPGCGTVMKKVKEPDITIDRCPKCDGAFLDKGELNVLATGLSGDIEFGFLNFDKLAVSDKDDIDDKFPTRKCTKCPGQKMKKATLWVCPTCPTRKRSKQVITS